MEKKKRKWIYQAGHSICLRTTPPEKAALKEAAKKCGYSELTRFLIESAFMRVGLSND